MITTEYSLPLGLGKTLALVTDLHGFPPDEVLTLLKRAKPDVICAAGDLFEVKSEEAYHAEPFLKRIMMAADWLLRQIIGKNADLRDAEFGFRFLEEAAKIAPVLFSPGNHDTGLPDADFRQMEQFGVRVLRSTDVLLDGIRFGGLDETVDTAFLDAFCGASEIKILLCHRPEYYGRYLKNRSISLVLSGHAHGGQVRIAGHGLFAPGQGLLPKYTHGVYDGKLVVSAGCSNTVACPRFGNPTELVLIHI